MSLTLYSIVGTIRVEPRPHTARSLDSEDSTLEQLLTSFARLELLGDATAFEAQPVHLVQNRRLHWLPASGTGVFIRANLAQLIAELETELDRLGGVAS